VLDHSLPPKNILDTNSQLLFHHVIAFTLPVTKPENKEARRRKSRSRLTDLAAGDEHAYTEALVSPGRPYAIAFGYRSGSAHRKVQAANKMNLQGAMMKALHEDGFVSAVPGKISGLVRRIMKISGILALAIAAPLLAQVDNGSITGIIHDASGSAVANAHVEITNTATNVKSEFTTNNDGSYEALGLIPGVYRVRATAPGFSAHVTDGVHINVQSIAKVDITLTVGDVKTGSSGQRCFRAAWRLSRPM
jgi:hypothetical protein